VSDETKFLDENDWSEDQKLFREVADLISESANLLSGLNEKAESAVTNSASAAQASSQPVTREDQTDREPSVQSAIKLSKEEKKLRKKRKKLKRKLKDMKAHFKKLRKKKGKKKAKKKVAPRLQQLREKKSRVEDKLKQVTALRKSLAT